MWGFTFRYDRIHFWGIDYLVVFTDCVIWHFELFWPAVEMNYQTLNHISLFLSFCCLKIFLSFCFHFTFTWTVTITGVHQIEYFSLHRCPLLTFWILCSSASCVRTCSRQWWLLWAPKSYLRRNMRVTSIFRQLNILIQEFHFQNFYLNLHYFCSRGFTFFLVLAWGITTLLRL